MYGDHDHDSLHDDDDDADDGEDGEHGDDPAYAGERVATYTASPATCRLPAKTTRNRSLMDDRAEMTNAIRNSTEVVLAYTPDKNCAQYYTEAAQQQQQQLIMLDQHSKLTRSAGAAAEFAHVHGGGSRLNICNTSYKNCSFVSSLCYSSSMSSNSSSGGAGADNELQQVVDSSGIKR
jgi:hypothetical protein